jgi:hypothetical protein
MSDDPEYRIKLQENADKKNLTSSSVGAVIIIFTALETRSDTY